MPKLKYSLFELNGNVLFTIYEQDERFRGKGEDICFKASNRIKVHSYGYPQIALYNNKTADVYLRGRSKSDDNNVAILNLKDYTHKKIDITPQDLIKKIDFALKEWAEEWEGWEEELPCKDEIVDVRIKEV